MSCWCCAKVHLAKAMGKGSSPLGAVGNGMEWGPLLIVLRWVRLQSAESQVTPSIYIYICIYIYIYITYPKHIWIFHWIWTSFKLIEPSQDRERFRSPVAMGTTSPWAARVTSMFGVEHLTRSQQEMLLASQPKNMKNGDWSNKDVDHGGVPKISGIPQTQDGFQFSTQTSLVDWWRKNHVCWSVWSVSRSAELLASEWQCRSRKIEQHTSNSGNWLNSNCCVNFDFDPCHVSQVFVWDH